MSSVSRPDPFTPALPSGCAVDAEEILPPFDDGEDHPALNSFDEGIDKVDPDEEMEGLFGVEESSAAEPVKLPFVAIIGRPNVGKSTLVNRILGARKSIVDDAPGITRDRSYHMVDWAGRAFTLIDTGGLVPEVNILKPDADPFGPLINAQCDLAMAEADVIVFVVDGQSGITALDEQVTARLRRSKKPLLLCVNKIDHLEQRPLTAEFFGLGLGKPYPVSAMHGSGGIGDMLDAILEKIPDAPMAAGVRPKKEFADTEDDAVIDRSVLPTGPIRLAFVGRPNVGKSSILNALLGQPRTIVSDISGTTRDAIDVSFAHEGQDFVLVDTAGIRRKGKVEYGVELFSVDRALRSIRQCDVAVLVLDAQEGVTDQDKRIIAVALETGCGLVIVINKWDTIPDKGPNSTETYKKELLHELPFGAFAPMVFTSANTGQRLTKILHAAKEARANNHRRVKTSLVNQVVLEAVALSPPPPKKTRRLKVLYATQVASSPPTFVIFVNDALLMNESYKRYLERKIRQSFNFAGTPINLIARSREEKKRN